MHISASTMANRHFWISFLKKDNLSLQSNEYVYRILQTGSEIQLIYALQINNEYFHWAIKQDSNQYANKVRRSISWKK
jgi:hypothetical protein